MSDQVELPKYRCHKEVRALKLSGMEIHKDGSCTVVAAADPECRPLKTKPGFASKFNGDYDDPGYYVLYKDGYESWSPTEAFEEGYTRL